MLPMGNLKNNRFVIETECQSVSTWICKAPLFREACYFNHQSMFLSTANFKGNRLKVNIRKAKLIVTD